MPDSIALTRIHAPEDYWLRMNQAEEVLLNAYCNDMYDRPLEAKACRRKAQQLNDRYHEYWDPKLYRLER